MNGREALKAILDCDADIEFFCDYENNWCPVVQSMWSVHKIKNADFKFRIRPKTVTMLVSGFELPMPFEPKNGEKFWLIDGSNDVACKTFGPPIFFKAIKKGVYRTEAEARLVAELLPRILRGERNE